MPSQTPAQASLRKAIASTAPSPLLDIPENLADHVLPPDDEVLLALPGTPEDSPRMLLLTLREVLLVSWGGPRDPIRRRREATPQQLREVTYYQDFPSDVRLQMDGARDLSVHPCTVEDAIQFVHRVTGLLSTQRLPEPLTEPEVLEKLHATGKYSPPSLMNTSAALWDRQFRRQQNWLQADYAYGSIAARKVLEEGERTFLLLADIAPTSADFLAVTDRRVLRGAAPSWKTQSYHPSQVTGARIAAGRLGFGKKAEISLHDGSTVSIPVHHDGLANEFVSAFEHLMRTGSLPPHLAIVPQPGA